MDTPKNHARAEAGSGCGKRQKQELQTKIRSKLMKLKLSLLLDELIVGLFEITPQDVKIKAAELKLPLNKTHVADLICHRTKAFDVEELKDKLWSLELYRIAFYSHLKRWRPVILLEPADDYQATEDTELIRRHLRQALRAKNLDAIIKVIAHEEMIWIVIVVKKLTRKHGMKLNSPIFLCYEVGTPYIFISSTVPKRVMESILKAMQFNSHKMQHLDGKDVKSLLTILKHKAINRNVPEVTFQPADYEAGFRSVDFSKVKSRRAYANKIFKTDGTVKLDTFKVKANVNWPQDNPLFNAPGMEGKPFVTQLTLKSKNVIDMIKGMAASGMMTTPLPGYARSLLRTGKNNITMVAPTEEND